MSLAAPKPRSWELGRATPKDEGILRGAIFRERMNPLFIDSKNFFVARSSNQVIGCGQIRPIGDSCFELASLAVDDVNRGQGIGAAIVSELVTDALSAGKSDIFLLTLQRTAPFYERLGFSICAKGRNDIPIGLQLEAAIGSVVAALVAQDSLVVMKFDKTETAV
eukprot:CAMPEP_0172618046 /NCGR_PEP_ID=MMETSP1068-20121228/76571_1 /TAXON_ID=35684 /ORGANISM="Pseudopedinella elastica, Strain CCMP716" /LENGTH=164 /DNA_ID=CAMNT_0013424067 /DNA_START=197 /DNA_END=691 /DNA_ORIENTATION=+